MTTEMTDEQIAALAATVKPVSAALLWWAPARHQDGAAAIEKAHQRRILGLHRDGVIPVLCPSAGSDTLAGIAIVNLPEDEAADLMAGDPCVQAGMMRVEIQPCVSFPGDAIPA